MPDASVTNVKEDAPKITVGTASGQPFVSKATCEMARPELKGKLALDGHTDRYGCSFVCPARPKAYDEAIKEDDKVTTMVHKAEAIWKAKISDRGLYDVAENEAARFIVDAVDDMWLADLKKKITIYADVQAIEMLEHLRKHCLGRMK